MRAWAAAVSERALASAPPQFGSPTTRRFARTKANHERDLMVDCLLALSQQLVVPITVLDAKYSEPAARKRRSAKRCANPKP